MALNPQVPLVAEWSAVPRYPETLVSDHTLTGPSVPPKIQIVPDTNYGSFGFMGYHHNFYPAPSLSSSSLAPPVTPEAIKIAVSDERHPPVVTNRTSEKSGPGSPRFQHQHPRAIYVQGLWIDEDDLSFSASRGDGSIGIHECQWAKSSNPCGMWIIASRSRFGAHVRKWHRQKHGNTTPKCLWDGCARTMLKDSINRHVLTVHMGERFRCHGCNQVFSRRDVYDRHAKIGSQACMKGNAEMVYDTERRVIDAREALH